MPYKDEYTSRGYSVTLDLSSICSKWQLCQALLPSTNPAGTVQVSTLYTWTVSLPRKDSVLRPKAVALFQHMCWYFALDLFECARGLQHALPCPGSSRCASAGGRRPLLPHSRHPAGAPVPLCPSLRPNRGIDSIPCCCRRPAPRRSGH